MKTCIHWVHYYTMKDVGLRIRVQKELRELFVEACRKQDKPAAQVLREFMRYYITTHDTALSQSGDAPQDQIRVQGLGKKKHRTTLD